MMSKKLPSEELKRLNSMCYFIEQIKKYKIEPKIIFDIGAYNAKHLQELGQEFNVPKKDLYAFEPHPGMIEHCYKRTDNVLNCVISDRDGWTDFNAIELTQDCNHGCSSVYTINRPHFKHYCEMVRIETLMFKGKLPREVDVVKIDVEGHSLEVLLGFGVFLERVKILHVETEIIEVFPGQKLMKDVIELMDARGFMPVHELYIPENQEDIIFLRKDLHFEEK
jgi:FkbM family methyltransferase